MRLPSPIAPQRGRRAAQGVRSGPVAGPPAGFRGLLARRGGPGLAPGSTAMAMDGPASGATGDGRRASGSVGGGPGRSPSDVEPSTVEPREAEGWVGLPPPPALLPPIGPHAPPPAGGSAAAHAEVAAMAERLLSSLRVGSVGRHGREVRMRLRGAFEGVEVRLRHAAGRLTAELHAPPQARARAARLAERLAPELASQGAASCVLQLR